jgi:signal transduction histidine kinase/ligand-binding sensor domain-containing protein
MPGRLFLFFLLLFAFLAKGQHHALRQYTAVDGLPQSQVNSIVEDRRGYLWIGTAGGGLACFDGREFKVYTTFDGLLSNIVTSLFIDSHDVIWAVHPQGITRFDGLTFRQLQPPPSPEGMKRIRRLVEYQDTLYIVSNPGLLGKIHGDSVYRWAERVAPNKTIFFTHVTARQVPCFYLSDSSFLIPVPTGYRSVSHAAVFNTAYNMYNHGSEVWLETDKGTFALDLAAGTFSPRKKMIQRYVIGYDSATSTYWTRDERTLFRERVTTEGVQTDTLLKGVPITQVLLDKEGNAWFGSAGNGLFRYYPKDFDKVFSGLRKVMAVTQDKSGNIWMGGEGLVKLQPGRKVKPYALPNGDDDGVRAILETPAGDLWIGSYSGLGRYLPGEDRFDWFTREHGLSSAYVTALEYDGSQLWIATTGGGLNRYDGNKFYTVATPGVKNIASLRYVPALKSLFVGTDFGLFVAREDGSFQEISVSQFEHTTILSMAAYRDTLLLAASGGAGVAIIDPQRSTQTFIGPREGLPSGFVFFVGVDHHEHVWIGTEKGITRIRLNDRLEITETRDYGFNNGLTGIETNPNSCFLSPNKKYFGLIDGLYEFLGEDTTGMNSYPVHLTSVEIFYGETPIAPYGRIATDFFRIPASLTLPFDKNHVTFTFNRVDKRYPNSVRYRYFLESFDKTWSQPSASGRVTYSNLPTGKYVFRVMATNQDGSWESPAIAYSFSVEAPFYRTPAFFAVMAGLIIGSLVLYILVRMRKNVSRAIELEHIRQREQEVLRKEIARDFHDEMGNQLTRIINYVSLMRLNGEGQGQDLYRKVEESAKYLYNGTRDFIWAIDPVNDDLAKLFLHIRDFGQKLFEEKDIHFRAFNETSEKVKLPYGFSREANLIFKEAMTNAFKHAGASNVSFWLRSVSGGYEMVLEDDGVGINPDRTESSNGIKNIRARAEKIKASLAVERRSEGTGTKVQLVFTINKKNTYDDATQKTRAHRGR